MLPLSVDLAPAGKLSRSSALTVLPVREHRAECARESRVFAKLLAAAAALLTGCSFDRAGLLFEESLVDEQVADAVADTRVVLVDAQPEDTSALADTAGDSSGDTADTADARDTATPCAEPGSVSSGEHCYFPIAGPFAFGAAVDACAAATPPAHLVSITSSAEQLVAQRVGSGDRWIGLRKHADEPSAKTSFDWITGEVATYDNWASGDPNGGHNCARMTATGTWADFACTNTFPAICERE